ncbi:S8 family peptidase [Dyella tabacisoli]|uniref:Protease n=1 Tax=Dyella tabacisoli TaxID=2282381 RepID=A0A369UIV2_9GAMM|nr:S8 family peptidase [Dyella tabacisoli]RDD80476.1 protease [Dyella tabacisoli]
MKLRTIQRCTLAVAMAMALPVAFAAGGPSAMKYDHVSTHAKSAGYDRFIVTYRDDVVAAKTPATVVQDITVALNRSGIAASQAGTPTVAVRYMRKLATGAELVRTGRKLNSTEANALMQQLATNPAVLYVEPDTLMKAISDTATPIVPNDPLFTKYQWHMRPGNGAMETIGKDTAAYANRGGSNASMAWNLSEGKGTVVAVLDTGITLHPDLDTSLTDAGYDFIIDKDISGRDTDGRVPGGWDTGDDCKEEDDPSSWHGTHVAGTIAELTNNEVGMAGVAPKAKVLPVRVLGHCGGYRSDIADAIVWASGGDVEGVPANQHPAQVMNMSLGGGGACAADSVYGKAIAGANSRGTSVVVAAGNSNADARNFSPASCPGVINVAANGITGKRAFYSNYGSSITLSAPGGGVYANDGSGGARVDAGWVWSTTNTGTTVPADPAYGGAPFAGTSMAAPHVAGVVALMVSARKDAELTALTPAEVRTALTSSARAFPSRPDQVIGAGIVDAHAAVQKAIDGNTTLLPTPLSNGVLIANLSGAAGDTLLYSIDVPADATRLNLRTLGGTGDVSLFIKHGEEPVADGANADFRSVKPGNSESVVIGKPAAGIWYLRVTGVKDFSKVSIIGSYKAP